MKALPDCDDLFMRFFDRWYSDDWRAWKGHTATRPDMEEVGTIAGGVAREISPLPDEGQEQAAEMVKTMVDAATDDWPRRLAVRPPISLAWIESFDAYYNRERIARLIRRSDPEEFGNEYVVLCCEFGAVLGTVLADQLATLHWMYAWPYWESMLFHSPTGSLIPPFHWAIKKMSEYGVDDGFAAKIGACVRILGDNEAAI